MLALNPPQNEPVRTYGPNTADRLTLQRALADIIASAPIDVTSVIDGKPCRGGRIHDLHAPHNHDLHLARLHQLEEPQIMRAVDSARKARSWWSQTRLEERASIFLRAAELLAGPWRDRINAATMLGQSKSVHQAEIDAACELIDFLRFNVHYAARIESEQPLSATGSWNRMDFRPLEGFILAITPFNFTSIAGNLPTAPAILGNVVVWKPATTQAFAAEVFMSVLVEAGLPPGVINLVHGSAPQVARACLAQHDFAGLHFTGSVEVCRELQDKISRNRTMYATFPRVVAETGGKNFVVAHPSAEPDVLVAALVRGAFEYQGQKCSAASRAYLPSSVWREVRGKLAEATSEIQVGDVSDFSTFCGAVIDKRAYTRHRKMLRSAAADSALEVIAGGGTDASDGWFVDPTVVRTDDPKHSVMVEEFFGPILSVYVYADEAWDEVLNLVDSTSPYGLSGAVFGTDARALAEAASALRDSAGNFYVNDKPTGAVVGQQPFGGGRASGTNDKAGSIFNLIRWVSPRCVKTSYVRPTDWRYPHQLAD